jgi:hypothetical protein
MPRCAGSKGDGTPCERIVGASRRYCFAHDPAKAEQRSRSASKAGRSKPLKELQEVREQLRSMAQQVLDGAVDRDDAGVASRILAVYLRAVEQERRVRELEDLLPRLAEIERRLDAEDGGRRWG